MNPNDPKEIARWLSKDPKVRREAARRHHRLFTELYLPDLIPYRMARMHHTLYGFTQDSNLRMAVVMAFRGSGKSTILSTSYPIWAILGIQQKKFVLIVAQTQEQARKILDSIRQALEKHPLLKREMGPFNERPDEWSGTNLVFTNHNARILVASFEQSIRGMKHGAHRPDLVILDDVQDLDAVQNHDSREKYYRWLTGEVMTIGDKGTKYILIGNKLHEESLVSRMAKKLPHRAVGIFPIVDKRGHPMWPGKFPTKASVEAERLFIGDHATWEREYMQNIVADADQIIRREYLKFYDPQAENFAGLRYTISSADLAVKQHERADKTAIITARVCGRGDNLTIYIVPPLINERLESPDITERLKALAHSHGGKVVVEDVAAQGYILQDLRRQGVAADGFRPQGEKRVRLHAISQMIATGRVLLPKKGAEELERQLIGFGVEKDDLVDSLTMLVLFVLQDESKGGSITFGTHPVVSRRWRQIEARMRIR